MIQEKKYYSISEVSEMLQIKEHVIRHWDSIDPKTNKMRIENLSIRTKGGTRFFSKTHVKKLENLKKILIVNGKRNYSLDLASRIIDKNRKASKKNNIQFDQINELDSPTINYNFEKLYRITNNLKKLIDLK